MDFEKNNKSITILGETSEMERLDAYTTMLGRCTAIFMCIVYAKV